MKNYQLALAAKLIALLLSACTPSLKPAPEAHTAAGGEPAAFSQIAGIRVTVVPNQWSGSPADLDKLATALRVTMENGSNQPLRIRYSEFRLIGPRSFTSAVIPPYKMEGTVIKPVFLPQTYVYPRGFELAPHFRFGAKDTSRPRHPWNYDEYTPKYNLWAAPLPTEDMLTKGMPEGVLEPEGHLSGFLYFEKLPDNLELITFEADLVNARTGATLGTARIPFVVR